MSTLEKCLICETVKDLINLINIYDLPFNIIK
ncbi:hypothetical protein CoNPh11_CDS0013 [Staphylococcus phage S-CoN_Ph11]|nr:hypothetical protein CoNPh11_CDS0013 [Staphylococcus phage S-CoN_Ph11]